MKRHLISEVKQLQKIAGILKEDFDGSSADSINFQKGASKFLSGIGRYLIDLEKSGEFEDGAPGDALGWIESFVDDVHEYFKGNTNDEDRFADMFTNKILPAAENIKDKLVTASDYKKFFDSWAAKFKSGTPRLAEGDDQAGMITTPSGTYDMADGIGLPYDDGKMARKFKAIAKSLNMKQGSEDGDTGDFFFGYERGDTPETADPSFISILNPTMQSNELIRKLAMQCIEQYD